MKVSLSIFDYCSIITFIALCSGMIIFMQDDSHNIITKRLDKIEQTIQQTIDKHTYNVYPARDSTVGPTKSDK